MRTRLFLEMLLASAVFLVFEVRAEADDWSREWYAEVTASSYMFSLGSVRADHAVWMLEGDAVQHLSGFGHVLLGYWALSDLEKKHDSGHRTSVYESDPYLFYGYDFDFAEGWRLRNRLGLIWVCNEGYDEKVAHLIREWTYAGELKSPCAVLFGQVRVVDGRGTFVRCGLKRVIEVAGGMFSIMPHVAMSGGSTRWNRCRYGDYDGKPRLSGGMGTVDYGISVLVPLGWGASFYVDISGYDAVDHDTRVQIRESRRHGMTRRTDAFVATSGVRWEF